MMDLAAALGATVLTSHIGRIPSSPADPAWGGAAEALVEIGYDGYLTIAREVGEDPAADIVTAAAFLREQIAGL